MMSCESHSWGIQAWWLVVKEKRSVVGMAWVVQTISTHLEVPPHIGIVEAGPRTVKHGEHCQQPGNHNRKGEDPVRRIRRRCSIYDERGRCAQAVPIS